MYHAMTTLWAKVVKKDIHMGEMITAALYKKITVQPREPKVRKFY